MQQAAVRVVVLALVGEVVVEGVVDIVCEAMEEMATGVVSNGRV